MPNISRRVLAIALTSILAWVFTALAIFIFATYSVALFVWLPFAIGASVTLIYGYKNTVTLRQARNASFLALLIYCSGLLVFAFEGIICIAMVAPIGFLFTFIGHRLAYRYMRSQHVLNSQATAILLLMSVPAFMSFEYISGTGEELRSVTTSVEINAPAGEVWKNVVQFPVLAEPTELLFRSGIAYPISAQIHGKGVGAVRHCNFSTGSFVEPITVWDEPKLLGFDVVDQPEPMKELSPYNLHPRHLHGYWVSKKGQFKLTALPNGHTRLEGTTWYTNKIKPGIYWTLWSDLIVHQIHQRVLGHIKRVSEQAS